MNGLEEKIEYSFKNRRLLETALTHSSYARENGKSYEFNNERLEFIGDAYLDAVIGQKLFDIMTSCEEGVLSKKRAAVVCEESLADVARGISLGSYLYLGKGEAASNGADKDSILSNALEAVFGAVIIDGGFDEGKRVINRLLGAKVSLAVQGKLFRDYKSEFQEMFQAIYKSTISLKYAVVAESGPAHNKTFTVEVSAGNKVLGRGSGKSKSKAEQAAAKDAVLKGEISVL